MTEEQLQRLQQIIDGLISSLTTLNSLADPFLESDEDLAEQAQNIPGLQPIIHGYWLQLDKLANELTQEPPVEEDKKKIEFYVLDAVLKTIRAHMRFFDRQSKESINVFVDAQNKPLKNVQAQPAFQTLSKLCEKAHTVLTTEINSLKQLLPTSITTQPILKISNPTPMITVQEISTKKSQFDIQIETVLGEHAFNSASDTLCQMRKQYGIIAIKLICPRKLPIDELAMLYKTGLDLLGHFALEVCVKATISLPGSEKKLLATYYISKTKTITICFEQYAPLVLPILFQSQEEAKRHLIATYKLKSIQDADAPWQLEELNLVAGALSKLAKRPQDIIVLTGCTLLRRKESEDDDPDAKVGGIYTPGTHTLTLTNAAFTSKTQCFYGTGKTIYPYSHGIILHEVGHIIEFHDWNVQRKQSNEGIENIAAQVTKAGSLTQRFLKQLGDIMKTCELEWQSYQKEMNDQQAQRRSAIQKAREEFAEIRVNVKKTFQQAIDFFNNACDVAPTNGSQEDKLFQAYLNQIKAMLTALNDINLSNQNLTLNNLASALETQTKMQEAQLTFKKFMKGAEGEYAYQAYFAQSLIGQVLDIAKLYPQIKREQDKLLADYNAWLAADELHQQELAARHKGATATAQKIYEDQLNTYTALMEKSLSTHMAVLNDAQAMYKERKPTSCLQKFIDFVITRNIMPITLYAKKEWDKNNKSEFFAESYHLFLNEPEFLQKVSLDLYRWFEDSTYM